MFHNICLGTELMTCSTDGTVKWWDTRKFNMAKVIRPKIFCDRP